MSTPVSPCQAEESGEREVSGGMVLSNGQKRAVRKRWDRMELGECKRGAEDMQEVVCTCTLLALGLEDTCTG